MQEISTLIGYLLYTGVKMEGVYNEGILLKRQRGLRASDAQRRNLKFQKRFCRLTRVSLDYYDKKASLIVVALFLSLCMHNTIN